MNPNGNTKNLTPFSSTYQPAKNGRKPSHLRKYIKDHNISTQDIRIILGGIIPLIKDEVKAMEKLKDPKTPFIIKIFLKPLIADYSKNKIDTARFLMEYGFGMPKQDIGISGGIDPVQDMNPADREKYIEELTRKRNERKNNSDKVQSGGSAAD